MELCLQDCYLFLQPMQNVRLVLFLLLTVFTYPGFSQPDEYRHEIIGTREGLQSSKIYALHQHASRRLWIGTELGVSIYNGYDFTNIQYSSSNVLVGRVLAIASDQAGGTWIGGDNGLFYAWKDGIKKITIAGRTSFAVECISTDAAGNVWVGEINGLYRIDAGSINTFYESPAATMPGDVYGKFNKRVYALHTDRFLNLYVAGFDGVFMFPNKSRNAQLIWQNPDQGNYVRSVAALSPDSVYWNCYDSPVMQKINGVVSSLPNPGFSGRNVFVHNSRAYALTTSGIAAIYPKSLDLLVSSENLSNLVPAALIDAEGNNWLGSWEGLIKFRKTGFKQQQLNHPRNTDAFSFLENRSGELLIGGNRGRVFKKEGNTMIPDPSFPLMFEKAELMTMYQHKDGSYWFGSGYQGISRFKNQKVRNWNGKTDELQNNNCESIFDAGNGKLFACTEKGVTIIDPLKENAIEGYYNYAKDYVLHPELFGGINADDTWLFYGSQGLYRLENGLLRDDSIMGLSYPSVYINKIVKDKHGQYWIATLGHGLLKCRIKNSRLLLVKKFDHSNGLPSDNILSVLVDKNNHVWSADYMSLNLLQNDENKERLSSFNEKDGLLNSYYQTMKLEQQKNGSIWGLTTMGIISFHPDSLNSNKLPPLVTLDGLTINDNDAASRVFLTGSTLKTGLDLSYTENSARFNFTALSLSDPSKIRYSYRLKGLDSNWTMSTTRTANYNFLRPGKYIFQVLASNNNNVWTTSPVQFSFTIHPPFWQTWWFLSLCILAAGFLMYALFRARVKRIKEKEAIRQQLAELEGKALRAQMNPHFIFNSLNAIQECIVMEKIDAAYEYLARFSKLLRMVLNNSEKNLISLQEEMEMITLYLELEALRFKNSFEYSIHIDDNIDIEMAEVPPLLLQPFIENAIWHGLRNKEGEKKLWVSCTASTNGLTCTIIDNGVGREKSQEIKAAKIGTAAFESRGMVLSEQRMQMMNLGHHEKFDVQVQDLYDDEGHATGTKVILQLPQILN